MKRLMVIALASTVAGGCIDFRSDFEACVTSGRCDGGGGGGSDDGGGGGSDDGGGGGGDGGGGGGGGGGGPSDGGVTFGVDCADSGWCWENPWPQGNDLTAVAVLASNDVWIAGRHSTMLHWSGSRWESRRSAFSDKEYSFSGLWGGSPSDVWAVAGQYIARWDGGSWTVRGTPANAVVSSISGNDAGEILAVGPSQGLSWNGSGFATVDIPIGTALNAVASRGPGDWWAVGSAPWQLDAGGFEKAGGEFDAGHQNSLWAAPDGTLFSAGAGNSLYRLDGGSGSWVNLQPAVTQSDYLGMWGSSANRFWVVGTESVIRRYDGAGFADEGVDWPADMTSPRLTAINGYGTGDGNVWAVGDVGLVFQRTPSGAPQWTARSSGSRDRLFALAFDGDQPYAVGASGTVLTRTGNAWRGVDIGTFAELDDLWAGGGEVVAVGGAIARMRAGVWQTPQPLPASVAGLEGIAGAPGELWAVGKQCDGGAAVLRSIDGGAFTQAPAPPGVTELWDVFWAGPGDVWVSGTNGQVAHLQQDGGWANEALGSDVFYGLWGSDGGELWAVGGSASVYRRSATGNWAIAPISNATRMFWDVWGSAADDVWVCGEDGIFHFDGANWSRPQLPAELIVDGNGIESVRAHGSMVFAVGTNGTILAAPR